MWPHTCSWRDDWRRPAVFLSLGLGFAVIFGVKFSGFEGVTLQEAGHTRTYRLAWVWFLIVSIPILIMLVSAVAGLTLPSASSRIVGSVFLFFAVGLACLALPAVAICDLSVSSQGLVHTAGLAWAPDTRRVEFASLSSITIVRPEHDRNEFVLEFHLKDGQVTSIPESTLLAAALPDVLAQAQRAKVPIERQLRQPGREN